MQERYNPNSSPFGAVGFREYDFQIAQSGCRPTLGHRWTDSACQLTYRQRFTFLLPRIRVSRPLRAAADAFRRGVMQYRGFEPRLRWSPSVVTQEGVIPPLRRVMLPLFFAPTCQSQSGSLLRSSVRVDSNHGIPTLRDCRAWVSPCSRVMARVAHHIPYWVVRVGSADSRSVRTHIVVGDIPT